MLNDIYIPNVKLPSRYDLPPRSTRVVPLKRYDQEYEAQRSRYPINRGNGESLSLANFALNTSLYYIDLPKFC